MADQLLPVRAPVLDSNGLPVSGAKVYVYATGTLTLADVWADAAGTTLLSNPVVADSAGVVAQIFVTEAVRVVVKTSADVTLYDIDPAPMSLAAGAAASSVTFEPVAGIAEDDVQAAIVAVNANIQSTLDDLGIGTTTGAPLMSNYDRTEQPSGFGRISGSTTGTGPADVVEASGGTSLLIRESEEDYSQLIFSQDPFKAFYGQMSAGNLSAWREFVIVDESGAVGDTIYHNSSNWVRLPKGTARQKMVMNTSASAPVWADEWKQIATGQTITSAGLVTGAAITHNLGILPKAVKFLLTCTTTDAGYSVADVISVDPHNNSTATDNRFNSITLTDTLATIRLTDTANVFVTAHKTTGAATALTNSSWTLAVYVS
ncbi:MAG: hypothetical protein ACRCSU_01080 [Paracoccaceae bacterium]